MFYPLKCVPIYKEKIWGGRNLKIIDKNLPQKKYIGEIWGLSTHPHGNSIIKNGYFSGKYLIDIINKYPMEMIGKDYKKYNGFPLLIKWIDAHKRLSVQVHPKGPMGKDEVWYIVRTEEDGKIIYGLKEEIGRKDLKKAIKENKIEETLRELKVKSGDIIYVPGGMVHGIGEGIIILEVQQNSDITYRLYDWNRIDSDGKKRKLHIHQALDAIDYSYHSNPFYFTVEPIEINGYYEGNLNGEKFEIYIGIDGDFEIFYYEKKEKILLGEIVLLPAALGNYKIVGRGKLIKVYL